MNKVLLSISGGEPSKSCLVLGGVKGPSRLPGEISGPSPSRCSLVGDAERATVTPGEGRIMPLGSVVYLTLTR